MQIALSGSFLIPICWMNVCLNLSNSWMKFQIQNAKYLSDYNRLAEKSTQESTESVESTESRDLQIVIFLKKQMGSEIFWSNGIARIISGFTAK
ncbi:hypothetical protein TTHERM_01280560 (macronuclear) [Tetrahymena thermophila SB210]|uniref:Uncharacterized protein n=1 Tax=Tetrahymena thermophila (strain SB210) TaxID=312017 RepID=Q24CN5_TETTS|nr:hypothetical protein TTHERM_01280560 [Tetrahymena thermophila SB210]EAS05529.2 hypothetical protein TTHERM_01280560 [Tetrahymena thermophila SB210]|eukprot:XP_001025774.2 hypothetical protein TTHERM_01280560 [Tetrahymena thermophila SB210]